MTQNEILDGVKHQLLDAKAKIEICLDQIGALYTAEAPAAPHVYTEDELLVKSTEDLVSIAQNVASMHGNPALPETSAFESNDEYRTALINFILSLQS